MLKESNNVVAEKMDHSRIIIFSCIEMCRTCMEEICVCACVQNNAVLDDSNTDVFMVSRKW